MPASPELPAGTGRRIPPGAVTSVSAAGRSAVAHVFALVFALVSTLVLPLALGGCSAGLSNGSKTTAAIGDCAADDFATGQVVFFGLTDNLGPGTIMKRYDGKGIGPEYLLGSVIDEPTSTVVHHGVDWACALGDSVARAFNAQSAVGILPVDTALNAKLAGASHLEVTVDSLRWDDLLAGPFRAAIAQSSDPGLETGLRRGSYLVESRALVAKGLKVTARFEASLGTSVKAALGEGRKILQQGKTTAVVDLAWDGTTELTITSPGEVYIAGRLMNLASGATDPLGQTLVRR